MVKIALFLDTAHCTFTVTESVRGERSQGVVTTPTLYSGGPAFCPRPTGLVLSLQIVAIFLSPSRKMLEYCLKCAMNVSFHNS
jgi:hypothetical protein